MVIKPHQKATKTAPTNITERIQNLTNKQGTTPVNICTIKYETTPTAQKIKQLFFTTHLGQRMCPSWKAGDNISSTSS